MDKNIERLKDGIARIISAYSPAEREAFADAVIEERDRLYRAKCWSDAVKTQDSEKQAEVVEKPKKDNGGPRFAIYRGPRHPDFYTLQRQNGGYT